MRTETITTIHISYKYKGGWHVFRSDEIPGLYIASQDAERAYNDVTNAIKRLVELDVGVECEVQRGMNDILEISRLLGGQKPLGRDFEEVWDDNTDILYDP